MLHNLFKYNQGLQKWLAVGKFGFSWGQAWFPSVCLKCSLQNPWATSASWGEKDHLSKRGKESGTAAYRAVNILGTWSLWGTYAFWRCFRDRKIWIFFYDLPLWGVPWQVGITWPIALSDCIGTPGAEYGLVIWGVFCLFKTFGNWPLTRYLFSRLSLPVACRFLWTATGTLVPLLLLLRQERFLSTKAVGTAYSGGHRVCLKCVGNNLGIDNADW